MKLRGVKLDKNYRKLCKILTKLNVDNSYEVHILSDNSVGIFYNGHYHLHFTGNNATFTYGIFLAHTYQVIIDGDIEEDLIEQLITLMLD